MFCLKCGADITQQDQVCPACGAETFSGVPAGVRQTGRVRFAARAGALAVDLLMLFMLNFVVGMFLGAFVGYYIPAAILFVAYFTWMIGSETGSTVGMRAQGLKVVCRKTGEQVGFGRALVRTFGLALSVGLLFVGCLLYFFTGGRMFHDIISGTDVVSVKKEL